MSGEGGYTHISEPPTSPLAGSGAIHRRALYQPPSTWRTAIIAAIAIALLAAIVIIIAIAAVNPPGSGGGGGDEGGSTSGKCDAAFNITQLRPDPTIVSTPPPRAFPVNQTFVHVVLIDRLQLSVNRSAAVLDAVFRFGIPQVLCAAELLRHSGALPDGSALHLSLSPYLLWLYLQCPSSAPFYCPTVVEQQQLVNAIAQGDVTFDAFPLTVETELLDEELLRWGVTWTQQLAQETGRPAPQCSTVVLTDVQGMTRAVVPTLNSSGVSAVLLATDERVVPIAVPSAFSWNDTATNSSIIGLCQHGLPTWPGPQDALSVPGFNHVLLPAFTSNVNATSSFTADSVLSLLSHAQRLFPAATVVLSTLDEFVLQLCNHSTYGRVELPSITAEIGSSSIVGAAADPLLSASYVNLLTERRRCLTDSDCDNCSRAFADFSLFALAAAHPVQGGNVTRFLRVGDDQNSAYWSWSNTAFAAVRDDDVVKQLQQSWNDSRWWSVEQALQSLPSNHSIVQRFRALSLVPPPSPDLSNLTASPLLPGWDTGDALVSFAADGSIVSLIDKASGINYAGSSYPLGLLLYRWMNEADYNASLASFLSCTAYDGRLDSCDLPTLVDYSKLGLDWSWQPSPALPNLTALVQTQLYIDSTTDRPRLFLFNLTLPANVSSLHDEVGAPSWATLRYAFSSRGFNVTVALYNLTSTRIPSASLLLFRPRLASPPEIGQIQACKAGRWLVEDGHAGTHVINSTLTGWAARAVREEGRWQLELHDTPVVARGTTVLPRLQDQQEVVAPSGQLAVLLQSNAWSRERAQWYPFAEDEEEQRNIQATFTFRML